MENYDVFTEMQSLEDLKIIAIIEDDEDFITNNLLNLPQVELLPVRYSYDLSKFSTEYIEKTKKLFAYYYNNENNPDNETLRLRKHFVHYRRTPIFAYIPSLEKHKNIRIMFEKLGIDICTDKKQVLEKVREYN